MLVPIRGSSYSASSGVLRADCIGATVCFWAGKRARLIYGGCCAICCLTLDRPPLDNAGGIIGSNDAGIDGVVNGGNSVVIAVADTSGITAKWMFLCVE